MAGRKLVATRWLAAHRDNVPFSTNCAESAPQKRFSRGTSGGVRNVERLRRRSVRRAVCQPDANCYCPLISPDASPVPANSKRRPAAVWKRACPIYSCVTQRHALSICISSRHCTRGSFINAFVAFVSLAAPFPFVSQSRELDWGLMSYVARGLRAYPPPVRVG